MSHQNKRDPKKRFDWTSNEAEIIRIFNRIFYEEPREPSQRLAPESLEMDQMLIYSYLINNIEPEKLRRVNFRRALFADFYLDLCKPNQKEAEKKTIEEILDTPSPDEQDGFTVINQDLLVEYCVRKISQAYCDEQDETKRKKLKKEKLDKSDDEKLRRLRPNNSAIMLSEIYKKMFKNRNLLRQISSAGNATDLKGLIFIDYIFAIGGATYLNRVSATPSLEKKAIELAKLVAEEYSIARDFEVEETRHYLTRHVEADEQEQSTEENRFPHRFNNSFLNMIVSRMRSIYAAAFTGLCVCLISLGATTMGKADYSTGTSDTQSIAGAAKRVRDEKEKPRELKIKVNHEGARIEYTRYFPIEFLYVAPKNMGRRESVETLSTIVEKQNVEYILDHNGKNDKKKEKQKGNTFIEQGEIIRIPVSLANPVYSPQNPLIEGALIPDIEILKTIRTEEVHALSSQFYRCKQEQQETFRDVAIKFTGRRLYLQRNAKRIQDYNSRFNMTITPKTRYCAGRIRIPPDLITYQNMRHLTTPK